TCKRELVSATDTRAMNRCDGRNIQRSQSVENALAQLNEFGQGLIDGWNISESGSWCRRRLVCHAGQCMDIGASDENVFLCARDNDTAQVGEMLDRVQMRIEFQEGGSIKNVGRRIHPVEIEDANPVAIHNA